MATAHPSLVGVWRITETDRKQLEQALQAAKGNASEKDAVEKMERALAHWQRLVVRIDAVRILGDIGDGLETRGYSVKGSWPGVDGLPVVDLEMRGGSGGPRPVSVMFLASNKVLFQTEGIRLPLQRTGG